MPSRGLEERLVVVGDGHLLPQLLARATRNVTFLGHVDQETLLRLYRTSRALVFPAEEDFGIAMAEAQACGTPVIALDRGGGRDIVDDGETGWLLGRRQSSRFGRPLRARADHSTRPRSGDRRNGSRFRFRSEIRAAVDTMVEPLGGLEGLQSCDTG